MVINRFQKFMIMIVNDIIEHKNIMHHHQLIGLCQNLQLTYSSNKNVFRRFLKHPETCPLSASQLVNRSMQLVNDSKTSTGILSVCDTES